MVSQKITAKGKKMLTEEIGEELIFDDVMAGMPITRLCKKMNVGTRVFYAWLHDKKEPERWSRYQQARKVAAETLVGETLEIADGVKHPEDVPKAKLQTQVRQWLASRYDPDTFGDKSGPTVNISLGDMHVQALKDITNKAKEIEPIIPKKD